MTVGVDAARALLIRLAKDSGSNVHRDIELWMHFGSADRRDREWSDRLPTDPEASCNGMTMSEAVKAGVPAASIRTSWKVPALTASLDAITSLIEATLPDCTWGVSIEPPVHGLTYHAYVGDHFPTRVPCRWQGESSYTKGKALALCIAFVEALVSKAEMEMSDG